MRISDWSSDVCSSDLVVTERFSIRGPIGGARLARRIWRHQCTRFEIIKLRAQKLLLPRRGRTQEDVLPDLRLAAVMPTTQAGHETESIGGLQVERKSTSLNTSN